MQTIKNDQILDINAPQNMLDAVVNYEYTGGTGFTSVPTVAFTGGAGSGAAGTAVLENGGVKSITITNVGTGYTSAPTVAITGGGSTGATAVATIDEDGKLATVAITSSGSDRKLKVTDNTSYPSGDSRAAANITVYDKAGNKAVAQIDDSPNNVTVDVIAQGLNPSTGLSLEVTLVSALRKSKDGSAFDIGIVNNSGLVTMEK